MLVGLPLSIALAFAAQSSGHDLDFTEAPPDLAAQEAARREAHIAHVSSSTAALAVDVGDTLFVEHLAKVPATASAPWIAITTQVRAPAAVTVMPTVELVTNEPGRVRFRVALRGMAPSQAARVAFGVNLFGDGEAPVATIPMDLRIRVEPLATDAEHLELDRRAFIFHQRAAQEAYARLPALHDLLRLDRLDPPPPPSRVSAPDRAELLVFLHHRLRANIARVRLRAAAELTDPELSDLATLALGALSQKPTGPAAKARAIEGVTSPKALQMAAAALEDLRIDEAEGFLDRLTLGGRLEKRELATALALLGAVHSARGRRAAAANAYGQALCLVPNLAPPLSRRFFAQAFAAVKAAPPCREATAVKNVYAKRAVTDDGTVIVVRAEFESDPHRLVSGGDVELWGVGGAIHQARRVRAEHDNPSYLLAEFEDTGQLENYAGQVLLKVMLKDRAGVVLASFGDPDPVPVLVGRSAESPSISVPWWVWAIAGGVAVAGAATAGVILLSSGETKQGVGPIEVRF